MALYRIKVNGRTEFVIKCDHCNWRTTSIESKTDYMAHSSDCPNCGKEIEMKLRGELPYPFDDYI